MKNHSSLTVKRASETLLRLPRLVPVIAGLVPILLSTPLAAQMTPIGLSEVRGQWFLNPLAGDRDYFAAALAIGDFNGDGAADLATGVPLADHPMVPDGADSLPGIGLSPGVLVLRQDAAATSSDELFGRALAAGDFNGDGFDDLAIGIPWDHQPNTEGAVKVIYGWSTGLQVEHPELITEADAGEPGHICASARFGSALAVGNFDADRYDDLAIGAPFACEGDVPGGAVFVAHGQDWGLLPFSGYRISQDSSGMFDQVEARDHFGYALASGDFNGDGFDDLSIGIPWEDESGAVQNIMGSPFRLILAHSVFWLPGAFGESPEAGDRFGAALAAGDFDGDGFDDLAIGVPSEDLGSPGMEIRDTGVIHVAYGAADPFWFNLSRAHRVDQAMLYGNSAHNGADDQFGQALAAGDFDRDGRDDLAIGHHGDDLRGTDHGAVTILMGAAPFLGASGRFRLLATGWEGLPGHQTQVGQFSGHALAAGDLDGDGHSDLAIGVPGLDIAAAMDTGAAAVLYGALFADGFELGSAGRWSKP